MSLHVRLFGAIELIAADQILPRLATAAQGRGRCWHTCWWARRGGRKRRIAKVDGAALAYDMPLESAQLNLRQTLYRLRQGLPDDATLLLSDRQAVQINPDAGYGCDVAEFLTLLSQAEQEQPPASAQTLARQPRFTATTCWPASSCPTARASRRGRRHSGSAFAGKLRTR
ncbi:MAG: hypothetical protein M9927_21660 [Anaerolineae bacterium]|nr:hypothetical protein [Anaerolineae bacterium]